MKVSVRIDNQLFDVDIENLYTRPIVAIVDGQRFEVWPEVNPTVTAVAPAAAHPSSAAEPIAVGATPTAPAGDSRTVHAPIPGVIVAISVAPGDTVEIGQELCVLEAMKMKNAIRAPHAGQIAAVRVAEGQHVKHHDPLIEYAE